MAQPDWVEWHRDYDDPGSLLSRRLELVQGHLRAELDHAPAGDLRLISLCAGQGRDVIGVLAGHPRRDDVRARLVELDERNVAAARQAAQAAGLDGVEAFYVTHSAEQTRLLAARAAELGLLTTGSSDFHGPDHPTFSRFRAFSTYGLSPVLGPIAG